MKIEGKIVKGEDMEIIEGIVEIEDGKIKYIEEKNINNKDVIIPSFINAHTHIGDSIAKEAGRDLTLEELVAPPDGLKHRILRNASRKEKIKAMSDTIELMKRSGTGTFIDFREGGIDGVQSLNEAVENKDIEPVMMGRENKKVLDISEGFGASGALDNDFSDERKETKKQGKIFGIHAGEVNAKDIGPAFDLEPDFLVHMVHTRKKDFKKLKENNIPVAVCPRSNIVTDVGLPPIEKLLDYTTVALGTDNVMTNSPSMWREMEFTSKLFDIPDKEILKMATINGAHLIDRQDIGVIKEGKKARLTVLKESSFNNIRDTIAGIVRRLGISDIKRVIFN